MCLLLSMTGFRDEFRGDLTASVVLVGIPVFVYGSWLLIAASREGFTPRRGKVWTATLCALTLCMQFSLTTQSMALHLILFWMLPLSFDCKTVVFTSLVLAVSIGLHDSLEKGYEHHRTITIVVTSACLPIGLSIAVSHLLSFSIVRAMRLWSSVDAGEALFTLLHARYDGVVELDENAVIVHASDTFFDIASAQLPSGRREASRQFLQISPETKDGSSQQGNGEAGSGSLCGQSFAEMLTGDEDRQHLESAFQEQKMFRRVALDSDDGGTSAPTAVRRGPATALHVHMRTQAGTEMKLRLYCTACYDVEARRSRFFLGVCWAEAPDDAPQGPDANLVVDTQPVLCRENLKVEATSPFLAVSEAVVLKGKYVAPGTPLNNLFPTNVMTELAPFVRSMCDDARPGESRHFGTLQPVGKGKHKVQDDITAEIVHDSRDWEDVGSVQILITIATRPLLAPGPRSSQSVASASAHSLPSIDEAAPDEEALPSSASEVKAPILGATGAGEARGSADATGFEARLAPHTLPLRVEIVPDDAGETHEDEGMPNGMPGAPSRLSL